MAHGGVVPSDPNDAISITVPSGTGTDTYYGNSPATSFPTDGFSSSLTFSQFAPSFNNTINDDDGDVAASPSISHNAFSIEWKDKYGQVVSNLSDTLSSCHSPYQLTISANNVKVHTQYGDPAVNSLGALSHTFQIYVNDYKKICEIRPYNMNWFEVDGTNWWKTQNGKDPNNINTTYGGGYKATEFDPFLGFSKNLSPTFPTTAFPEAKFSIVVPEPQTQYSISLVSGNGIATPVQAIESSGSNLELYLIL